MDYCTRKKLAAKSVNKYLGSMADLLSFAIICYKMKLMSIIIDDVIKMKLRTRYWK